jgi:hypothetical protein
MNDLPARAELLFGRLNLRRRWESMVQRLLIEDLRWHL